MAYGAGAFDVDEEMEGAAREDRFHHALGARWFKGVTLFSAQVSKTPDVGVYLGIFKVLSTTTGFKIMVNEHNRIMVPLVFLTESQLEADDLKWVNGVRVRETFGIDLLEGGKPNRGWLGPEMSGEEGATFPEKLWWAIDEAKARLDTTDIGKQYDKELLFIDEKNNIQLLLYGVLAKDASDVLPGHIWVDQPAFLVENMKYFCPTVLEGMLKELQGKIDNIMAKVATSGDSLSMDEVQSLRREKQAMIVELKALLASQTPLKWVDRVIIWCADKMPTFTANVEGKDADECVAKAQKAATDVEAADKARNALIAKYGK